MGTPASDAIAVTSSGPIIQGIGVDSQTHANAASKASTNVPATLNMRTCAEAINLSLRKTAVPSYSFGTYLRNSPSAMSSTAELTTVAAA